MSPFFEFPVLFVFSSPRIITNSNSRRTEAILFTCTWPSQVSDEHYATLHKKKDRFFLWATTTTLITDKEKQPDEGNEPKQTAASRNLQRDVAKCREEDLHQTTCTAPHHRCICGCHGHKQRHEWRWTTRLHFLPLCKKEAKISCTGALLFFVGDVIRSQSLRTKVERPKSSSPP